MSVEFKVANRLDLPYIVDVYNQNIASRKVTADLTPVNVQDRLNWMKASDPNHRPIWLILNDDELAGWVSLENFYGRAAYQHTAEISIYIDENFQNKGLGTKALAHVEQQAPLLQVHTILAYVFGHNVPSQHLFKKQGFETWGHLPKVAEMDGREYDLDILGKRIE